MKAGALNTVEFWIMTFAKLCVAATLILAGSIGAGQPALAADSCEAQVTALASTVAAVTDAATQEKATKLLKKAADEATVEADEDECLDYLKSAKQILGIQ